MTPLEEAITAKEIFRQDLDVCRGSLSRALATRDDALGRAALAERRAVNAEASESAAMEALTLVQNAGKDESRWSAMEVDRLRRQRIRLAHHVRDLLQRERQRDSDFHHVYRALSLPPLLWPFIGIGLSFRRTLRRVIQSMRNLRRKDHP